MTIISDTAKGYRSPGLTSIAEDDTASGCFMNAEFAQNENLIHQSEAIRGLL